VSRDPIGYAGGDMNLYRYVGNASVIYVDALGLTQDAVLRFLKSLFVIKPAIVAKNIAVGTAIHAANTKSISGNQYGDWVITQINSDAGTSGGPGYESDVTITFKTKNKCDCNEIAFVQIVRHVWKNADDAWLARSPNKAGISRRSKDGWFVDKQEGGIYGWYAFYNDGKADAPGYPVLGHSLLGKSPGDALHEDSPAWNAINVQWEFEAVAICKKGKDANKIYGSISWGFNVDSNGRLTSLPPTAHDTATNYFMPAVDAWNKQADDFKRGFSEGNGGKDQVPLPKFVSP